jgi:hypothetical protein
MKLDIRTLIAGQSEQRRTQFIRRLLNTTEGFRLTLPTQNTENEIMPDLWQGYENLSEEESVETIICFIKAKLSIEQNIKSIRDTYEQYHPSQLLFILLDDINEEEKSTLIGSLSEPVPGFRLYDVDDLNVLLKQSPEFVKESSKGESIQGETVSSPQASEAIRDTVSIESIKERIISSKNGNFWWINASPDYWEIDNLKIGDIKSYTTHEEKRGVKRERKIFEHFFQVEVGDLAIGYQSGRETKAKVLFEITKNANERSGDTISFKVLYFFQKQPVFKELKKSKSFKGSEVSKYNNLGSLFSLSYQEFKDIVKFTEIGVIKDESDNIPFNLDNVENTDRLNREPIATSLAGLINNDIFNKEVKTRYAFMLHLQGEWGEGKSTFLNLLKKRLNTDDNKWIVVDFNAWRNQHIDPPWWSFLDTVYKDAISVMPWYKKPFLHFNEGIRRIAGFNKMPKLVSFIITLIMIWVLIRFQDNNFSIFKDLFAGGGIANQSKDLESYVKLLLSIGALIGLFFSFSKFVSAPFFVNSPSRAKSFMEHAEDPMKLVKKHFSKIVRDLRFLGYHLAVFIDDIDRCNAPFTVHLLEGIQTLFKDQRVLYVVAGDKQWITACFENNYENYQQAAQRPGQRLGYLFLEKAFQLSIRLPRVAEENIQEYWEYILNPDKRDDIQKQKTEKTKQDIFIKVIWKNLKDKVLKQFSSKPVKEDDTNEKEVKRGMVSLNKYKNENLTNPEVKRRIAKEENLKINQVNDAIIRTMDESKEDIEHLFRGHYKLIDANPRLIKRLANQYSVQRNILITEDVNLEKENREKLFRWLMLQSKYPVFTEWLEQQVREKKEINALPEEFQELWEDDNWNELLFNKRDEEKYKLLPEDIIHFVGIKEGEN